MNYVWDFAILGKYSHLFWLGLGWTMAYTIGTIVLGTLIGLVVGIIRLRRLPVIRLALVAYIETFRCTPLLVQIIWFYYALPVVLGQHTRACRGHQRAVALWRRVLRRDHPRQHREHPCRPMGRGAGAGLEPMAGVAAGDPAAGA